MITRAFAVLWRPNSGVLLLKSDRWQLPGGRLEPGERPREAVARETWEETGIAIAPEAFQLVAHHGDRALFVAPPLPQVPRVRLSWEHNEARWGHFRDLLDISWISPEMVRRAYNLANPEGS